MLHGNTHAISWGVVRLTFCDTSSKACMNSTIVIQDILPQHLDKIGPALGPGTQYILQTFTDTVLLGMDKPEFTLCRLSLVRFAC